MFEFVNKIFKNGNILKEILIVGNRKTKLFIFSKDEKYTAKTVGKIEIQCQECKNNYERFFHRYFLKKNFICFSCNNRGEKNSFYGKTHTNKTKKLISKSNKGKLIGDKNPSKRPEVIQKIKDSHKIITDECKLLGIDPPWILRGEQNGFYGKQHSKELMDQIVESGKRTIAQRTEEEKMILSEKLSQSQKTLMKNDPEKYSQNKRNGGIASAISLCRYKMNDLERKFKTILDLLSLDFEYSVILGYKQYDFGNKNNIADLNEVQLAKKERDIEKYNFAIKHGFKIFTVWERDIKLGNLYNVLKDIMNAYKI